MPLDQENSYFCQKFSKTGPKKSDIWQNVLIKCFLISELRVIHSQYPSMVIIPPQGHEHGNHGNKVMHILELICTKTTTHTHQLRRKICKQLIVTSTGLSLGRPCGKRVFSSCIASNILCLASNGRRSDGIDTISLLIAEIKGNWTGT